MIRRLCIAALLFAAACGQPADDKDDDPVVTVNSDPNNSNGSPNNDGSNNAGNNEENNEENNVSNGTNSATNNSQPALTIDEYRQLSAEMWCELIWDCPNASTHSLVRRHGRHGDPEACAQAVSGPMPTHSVAASVEAGAIEFDPDAAQSCLEQLRERGCDGSLYKSDWVPECLEAVVGTVPIGSECYDDWECAEGYCDPQIACGSRVCTAYGESPCGATTCDATEWCDRSGDPDVCQARLPIGSTCRFGQCQSGAACTHAMDGTCVELYAQGAGDPCVTERACGVGLVCDTDRLCRAMTFVGPGEDCRIIGAAACEPGLFCQQGDDPDDPLAGTCMMPQPAGTDCTRDAECVTGTFCDVWNDSTCKAYQADGAACQVHVQCESQSCPGGLGGPGDGVCEPRCSR